MILKKPLMTLATLAALSMGAQAANLVVIGSPASPPITKDQLVDVYLGKAQVANPVDIADSNPLYAEFYQKATGRDVTQIKSTWSRIVFSGKGQPPKQYPDAAAIKKAVAADPKAIGYIDKSAVDGTVKVLIELN